MTAERELRREIGRIPPGAHLCLVYDTAEEQLAAVVPYIEDGLARRDRCVYIVDERSVDEIELALGRAGVGLARARRELDVQGAGPGPAPGDRERDVAGAAEEQHGAGLSE